MGLIDPQTSLTGYTPSHLAPPGPGLRDGSLFMHSCIHAFMHSLRWALSRSSVALAGSRADTTLTPMSRQPGGSQDLFSQKAATWSAWFRHVKNVPLPQGTQRSFPSLTHTPPPSRQAPPPTGLLVVTLEPTWFSRLEEQWIAVGPASSPKQGPPGPDPALCLLV